MLALQQEWISLAKAAIEPSPFYEYNFLKTSIEHLRAGNDCQFLLIRSQFEEKLVGLFPFDLVYPVGKLGKPILRLHYSPYVGKTTPLVAGIDPGYVWRAAFEAISERVDISPVVELSGATVNRPVSAALLDLAAEQDLSYLVLEEFERPLLEWNDGPDEYCARRPKSRRKSIKQRLKKLKSAGEVCVATSVTGEAEYAEMFEKFLVLEASGWKGKRKTAFSSRKDLLEYARAAFCPACSNPRLQIDILSLDNVAIAANVSFVSGGALYALKSAYDETYRNYGPGLLLDYLTTNTWLAEKKFAYVDSCALPDSPLAELWLEREKIQHALIATNHSVKLRTLEILKKKHMAIKTSKTMAKKVVSKLLNQKYL